MQSSDNFTLDSPLLPGHVHDVTMTYNTSSGGTDAAADSPATANHHRMPFLLITYTFPVILLLGTVGNILCICVLRRKAMQTNCSSVYLTVLAVTDTYIIWLSGFKTWIRVVFDYELLHVSDAGCKILKYLFYSSTHISAWLVVTLTLERFVVVYFPFKSNKFCCSRRPDLVVLAICLVIFAYNINVIASTELIRDDTFCRTYLLPNLTSRIFPVVNLFTYCLIPSVTVFALNGAIIVIVVQSVGNVKTEASGENLNRTPRSRNLQYHQHRLTVSLLTISVLWLLLATPYSAIEQATALRVGGGISQLARIVCFLLFYMNHATTFYIYCITGRKFRQELKRLFMGHKNTTGKNTTPRSFHAGNFLLRSTHSSHQAAQLYS